MRETACVDARAAFSVVERARISRAAGLPAVTQPDRPKAEPEQRHGPCNSPPMPVASTPFEIAACITGVIRCATLVRTGRWRWRRLVVVGLAGGVLWAAILLALT